MKKLSCKMMGDENCRFEARGNDEKEVMEKMKVHMKQSHPDMTPDEDMMKEKMEEA